MADGKGGTMSYDNVARNESYVKPNSNDNKKTLGSVAKEADKHSKNCNDVLLGGIKILR